MQRRGVWLSLALLVCGCRAVIRADLSAEEAGAVVTELKRGGVAASSGRGQSPVGRYSVEVPSGEVLRSLQLLEAARVGEVGHKGFAELYGEPGLVPTPAEERARLSAALSGELSRSLERFAGVVDARVHVLLGQPAGLVPQARSGQGLAARASAVVRHRPGESIDRGAILELIGASVPGLAPEQVHLVLIEGPSAPTGQGDWTQVGQITVSRGSAPMLRLLLGLALGVTALMSLMLVFLVYRLRRARQLASKL